MPGPVSQMLQFDLHATDGLVTDGLEGLRAMRSHTTGRATYFAREYSDCRLLPLDCISL